ncbi:MAG: hypothetical protein U0T82_12390 [Bacteroidales bacterium]
MRFAPVIFPVLAFFLFSCHQVEKMQLTDYHVHLKGDFTLEKAIARSDKTGTKYGIAVNCGLGFPVQNDSAALAWLDSMRSSGFLLAMQAEGREWLSMFSPSAIESFDYVFTDAMTFTDDSGKRMRLWIKEEVSVPDTAIFMETLLTRIESILNNEPIDIYVNPTYLPECISANYERLWTRERMMRVINSARKNNIAIEINDRFRLPSEKFIKLAKENGVIFSCGTNNADSNFGDLEYCREMIKKCGLTKNDFFVPSPAGQKPINQARFQH